MIRNVALIVKVTVAAVVMLPLVLLIEIAPAEGKLATLLEAIVSRAVEWFDDVWPSENR